MDVEARIESDRNCKFALQIVKRHTKSMERENVIVPQIVNDDVARIGESISSTYTDDVHHYQQQQIVDCESGRENFPMLSINIQPMVVCETEPTRCPLERDTHAHSGTPFVCVYMQVIHIQLCKR